jgi:hypothetical protein
MTACECHRETGSHELCCGHPEGRNPDCPTHGDGSGPNAVHQPVGFARWHNPAVFTADDRVTAHPFVPVEGHVVCGDCGFARGTRLGNRPLHPLPRVSAVTA